MSVLPAHREAAAAPRPRTFGGEMALDPAVLLRAPAIKDGVLPKAAIATCSGRTALGVALDHLGLRPGAPVLLPSYLCASVVQPCRERGLAVAYYRVGEDLAVDVADLERKVAALSPEAVLFINYFGFPPAPGIRAALAAIGRRVPLIEDCAMGSLIESGRPPVGGLGRLVVASLRKIAPLPDGGLVFARDEPIVVPPLARGDNRAAGLRLTGLLLRHLLGTADEPTGAEEMSLALLAAAERQLDQDAAGSAMSNLARRILGATDLAEALARRRVNFRRLAEAFRDEPRLAVIGQPLFAALPDGVSPLTFPLRVAAGARDRLRAALRRRRVFCPVHWLLPDDAAAADPGARRLSQDMLGLPLDQRYRPDDMDDLVARVIDAWQG